MSHAGFQHRRAPAWKRFIRGPGGMISSSVAFAVMNFLVKRRSR